MNFLEIERSHLEDCAVVFQSVFNAEPWNESWTAQTASQKMLEIFKTPGFLGVLAVQDNMLGFAMGNFEQRDLEKHFHIKEFCVLTSHQGQGIGSALLEKLLEQVGALGGQQTFLLTRKETQAEWFYARRGFRSSQRMVVMTYR